MTTAIITPPALEPLSLADAKLHLRIDHASEDDFLSHSITAARQYIEAVTGMAAIRPRLAGAPLHPHGSATGADGGRDHGLR